MRESGDVMTCFVSELMSLVSYVICTVTVGVRADGVRDVVGGWRTSVAGLSSLYLVIITLS